MYGYELLYAYTGDKKWAERLETLAFNALPAAISDDMWSHQYVQMSNQISCIRFPGKSVFRTNNSEAHLFGLEPNYGCCTANFSQGWPKLTLSAFMFDGDAVINAVPVPAVLKTKDISIELETNYPFENTFVYKVKADKAFTFKIRVPAFAENCIADGKQVSGEEVSFSFEAGESREVTVSYDITPRFVARPFDLNVVKRGSLLFALPIKYHTVMKEYERDGVERKYPYCDYEYYPDTDWNYGYADSVLTTENRILSDTPFSSVNPPVVIKAKVKKINWGYADGYDTVCAKIPESREGMGEAEEVELYPYGCAKLRMTELPFVKEN